MTNDYTIFLDCLIEINGHTQEVCLGMCGTVSDNRAYDLAWDEAWVGRYFDADLFYEDFMQAINADQIDRAYDNHKDRELRGVE